jgi:hypothetical protein
MFRSTSGVSKLASALLEVVFASERSAFCLKELCSLMTTVRESPMSEARLSP